MFPEPTCRIAYCNTLVSYHLLLNVKWSIISAAFSSHERLWWIVLCSVCFYLYLGRSHKILSRVRKRSISHICNSFVYFLCFALFQKYLKWLERIHLIHTDNNKWKCQPNTYVGQSYCCLGVCNTKWWEMNLILSETNVSLSRIIISKLKSKLLSLQRLCFKQRNLFLL